MIQILIVDDEPRIRQLIREYLEHEGFSCTEATDGSAALAQLSSASFDLVLLDIMMPFVDGMTCLKEMRARKLSTPVIMLTARGEEYDKIHGFELGVDDYVVKPFSPKELMMRIGAILKRSRSGRGETGGDVFAEEGLRIDFSGRVVTVDGEKVELSPKEYDLLFYMVNNRNIALTREQLITNVWGYDFYGDDRTLDTHIKLLRKSLGEYSGTITTLRGVGYRFEGC